jgi:ubiquinone/menaquinone biosynthesis C-methylase UbiE
MDIEVVDIRAMTHPPRGMIFKRADAEHMTGFPDNSISSLSSLNAAEHFGLGRYGDKIDPDGHVTFMKSLQRVLAPGGRLYFSVPVSDDERVEFNAHRVLSPTTVTKAFDQLRLLSFSCIKDDGLLAEDVDLSAAANQRAGCGLFEFAKDAAP